MVKKEAIVKQLEKKLAELEVQFLEEKANEVVEARQAIVEVLKEREISLPGAVFACQLVVHELMRSQLEAFLGHVKLADQLPLSNKVPVAI